MIAASCLLGFWFHFICQKNSDYTKGTLMCLLSLGKSGASDIRLTLRQDASCSQVAAMLKVCLLVALAGAAFAKDSYVIVAPTTLRPGMDFEISANILKATGDVNVKATLKNGKQTVTTVNGVLKQDTPQTLSLQIPKNIGSGSYELEVTGSGGLTFSNKTSIKYSSKSMSIFIQTDKAMYKPGQTVNFRVFGIYPDMKTYTGLYTIEIFDKNSNKIKQWVDVQDASGVITNFLSMSDQPVLGDWKIKVTAGHISEEKAFTIAEYVLPKFEVTVELPTYALSSDSDITATVKAKYTYGKPVKGTVTLALQNENYYRPWKYVGPEPMITKTLTIDGEGKVIIPMTDIKNKFNNIVNQKLKVSANVTESLTGIKLSGSSSVKVYQYATKLSFSPADPKTFKPGLKYIAYLQVQQQDGRPVLHSTSQVVVKPRVTSEIKELGTTPKYFYPRQMNYQLAQQSFSVPDNGVVPIELDIPENATSISLNVNYGKVTAYKSISKSYSPSNNYIQLTLKSQQLSAGNNVNFNVKATEAVDNLVYQVMARGSLASAGTVSGNNQKLFNFNIPVTTKMAPNARIIVYYVRKDGEIVTDSVSFDVEGAFENQVSISMDKSSAKPGESVNVEVTADPSSLVNLLAVDQSVLLLKSGNDVTQAEVLDELKSYDTLSNHGSSGGGIRPFGGIAFRRKRMAWCEFCWGFPTYYGGSDATQIFKNAGVTVMTDALVYKYVKPYYRPRFFARRRGRGGFARGNFALGNFATNKAMPSRGFGGFAGESVTKLAEPEKTRVHFPETWLWVNQTTGTDGKTVISTHVPDTITSWVASAFAVNGKTGLGVAPTTAKIQVFRPFFVSLNLPYSVTRGEQVALQAIVFNYLTQDVDAVVSLPQSQEYQNVIIDSTGRESIDSKDQMQTVRVKAGGAESVFFPIIPTKLGKIDFTVSARSTLAADAVKRQLLVEAEGTPKEYSVPVLIDLKKVTTFTQSAPITLPSNVVQGSLSARVTAIGDLMGPSVSGLDHLLRMPTGCGEQTMLGFAPDVFITNYLTATNQLTGDIEDKALGYMEKGYQRELTYQHKDGSFSAFGDRDDSGSMWLTAFVVKTFHQAKPHIFIDDDVMKRGIDWMISKQSADGSFPEPGRVIHKDMTGGSGKGTALTAFVVIALLENDDLTGSLKERTHSATARAVEYLEKQTITDDYTLAITTYALQLAGSQKTDSLLATLNSHAINKDGFQYWHRPEQTATQSTKTYWRRPHSSKAIDIEMTSYALLTFHARNNFNGGLNIMKWIASQRNPNGGFSSTQDTVLALQSLSEFAKMAYSNNFDVQVTITAGTFTHHFSINQNNALVLQSVDLPSVPSSVQVQATGNGIALVEVGVFFNVDADVEEPTFDLTYKILEEDINSITLQTCATWQGTGSSGMAIQEVGVPSGFEVDTDAIKKMKTLKKIETPNKKVVLYFDEIGTSPVCLTFSLLRTGLVAKSQPVPIRVYDYYEPTNQKTIFYESKVLKNSNICNVCADCENCSRKGK